MNEKTDTDGLTRWQRWNKNNPEKRRHIMSRSRQRMILKMTPEQKINYDLKRKDYWKAYRQRTKDHRRDIGRKWAHTDKGIACRARAYKIRKLKLGIGNRRNISKQQRDVEMREYRRLYWINNKAALGLAAKNRWLNNKEKYDPARKRWYIKNKRDVIRRNKMWQAKRKASDPSFRIASNTYRQVYRLIKEAIGSARKLKIEVIVGCTKEQLVRHLESQFTGDMSWNNYGKNGWSIDHRTPVSNYDLTDEKQRLTAFHWSNLQPMWAHKNSEKGNRFVSPPIGQLPLLMA